MARLSACTLKVARATLLAARAARAGGGDARGGRVERPAGAAAAPHHRSRSSTMRNAAVEAEAGRMACATAICAATARR